MAQILVLGLLPLVQALMAELALILVVCFGLWHLMEAPSWVISLLAALNGCIHLVGSLTLYRCRKPALHLPSHIHMSTILMQAIFQRTSSPSTRGTPSPIGSGLATDAADKQEEETIDIDDDETPEPARTEKRLNWSHEEDVRLVSAWLQNSLDPVDGNDKKSDQYWADVTATYNSNTPSNRRRNRNQLKIRWDRVKKPVSEFHGCWVRTTRVFQSGASDDQRTDQALQMYASEHGDKPFLLQHIWRVVRHERKWAAYVKKLNKETENSAANVVNVENSPKKRPVGHKKAKDERNGKRKTPEAISAIGDKLDKFIDASTKAEKVAERQESLANKKLEVAKEQTKIKMIDLYKDLLCGSTSDLSEEALAERSKALDCLRSALFAKDG